MALVKAWEVLPHLETEVNNGIDFQQQIQFEERATDPTDDNLVDGRIYHQTSVGLRLYEAGAWSTLGSSATGDITGVIAGAGLTGGGLTGTVTLAVANTDGKITVGADTIGITAGSLVNADINASADIAWSKMATSTDISSTGTVTDLTVTGETSGDVLYFDGTNWIHLAATSLPAGTASVLAQSVTIEAGTYDATLATTTQTTGATTLTIPDFAGVSDTFVFLAATQTLTNKTLTSPTLTTPALGVASATSVNKVTITAPATTAVLTIIEGKTLTCSNTLTFTGTDSSSVALGTGGTVSYYTDKLSVFAATTSAELAGVISDETGNGLLVFATSPTLTTPTLTTPSLDGLIGAYVTKSAAYTATATDYVIDVAGASGSVTITLPTAASITGTMYVIKRSDTTYDVVIDGDSSETIDGAATVTLSAQYQFKTIMSDGTNWKVVASG